MLLLSLLEAATMYGSVSRYDGRARVWVNFAFAYLKWPSVCLMYDCPKILSFIASMVLKFYPHL